MNVCSLAFLGSSKSIIHWTLARSWLGMGNSLQLQALPENTQLRAVSCCPFQKLKRNAWIPKWRGLDSTPQHPMLSTLFIAWVHFFSFFLAKSSGQSSSRNLVELFSWCNKNPVSVINYSLYIVTNIHCLPFLLSILGSSDLSSLGGRPGGVNQTLFSHRSGSLATTFSSCDCRTYPFSIKVRE